MGDISTIANLFEKSAEEFYGWREEQGLSVAGVLFRGFNFLQFKNDNPCADMYYTEMRWTAEEEQEIRHGVQQGHQNFIQEPAALCLRSRLQGNGAG